jgi:hypothetical protein
MSFSDYWNLAKGWFGYSPEQKVGKDLGGYLGQLGQAYIPIPGVNGKQFGEWVGSFLPFKEGGRIGFNPQRNPPNPLGPLLPFEEGGIVEGEPDVAWDAFQDLQKRGFTVKDWDNLNRYTNPQRTRDRERLGQIMNDHYQKYPHEKPISVSNIRQQMESEGDMIPMKKGGRVKKRKHTKK